MPFRFVVCNIHAAHKTINCYSVHAVSISRVKISFIDLFLFNLFKVCLSGKLLQRFSCAASKPKQFVIAVTAILIIHDYGKAGDCAQATRNAVRSLKSESLKAGTHYPYDARIHGPWTSVVCTVYYRSSHYVIDEYNVT